MGEHFLAWLSVGWMLAGCNGIELSDGWEVPTLTTKAHSALTLLLDAGQTLS